MAKPLIGFFHLSKLRGDGSWILVKTKQVWLFSFANVLSEEVNNILIITSFSIKLLIEIQTVEELKGKLHNIFPLKSIFLNHKSIKWQELHRHWTSS